MARTSYPETERGMFRYFATGDGRCTAHVEEWEEELENNFEE